MTLEIPLKRRFAAVALVVCVVSVCALLARQVLFNFIVFSLSDSRSPVGTQALETATGYFPSSARLNARLAEAEISDPARDLELAAREIERATRLSPYDYRLLVVMASVKESQRDLTSAENALRSAASLAPSNIDVRWRLANLLLREGKTSDSLAEFRTAASGDQSLMPATLDLVWRVTGGDLASLQSVAPATAASNLSLATFLIKHGQTAEAARIFEGVDREARREAVPASSDFIRSLVNSGEVALARRLWIDLVSGGDDSRSGPPDSPIIWNGGFESDPIPGLGQFDWNLAESDYAVVGIDANAAHQGSRSLRIDFAGRDTTRLNEEIKQSVALHPGRHYRLEYYVKTRDFVTTDGPRMALRSDRDPAWTPAGTAILAGTSDWRKVEMDFTVPALRDLAASSRNPLQGRGMDTTERALAEVSLRGQGDRLSRPPSKDAVAVTIRLIRTPRFSYDEPMRGTIWLDDFRIIETD